MRQIEKCILNQFGLLFIAKLHQSSRKIMCKLREKMQRNMISDRRNKKILGTKSHGTEKKEMY